MLELSSNTNELSQLERFVKKIAAQYRLDEEQYGNVLISLTEAVSNAIIHGNKKDSNKKVCISLIEEKNKISISVSDQGKGFDVHKIPDPTTEERLFCIGGRGVYIMKRLCDGVCYCNNGSTVTLEFKI
ncbi:MAG: ATP-binding protein [Saprospiraceae bacterium]|jgi:serine/threonine-protein kinase RsbW